MWHKRMTHEYNSNYARKEVMNFDINYPLVLDLDGTLIRIDLTHELLLRGLLKSPIKAVLCIFKNIGNKAVLKEKLVEIAGEDFDVKGFPYNQKVIDVARAHHEQGGTVILCSGSHKVLVDRVAKKFDWIDVSYGSTVDVNLTKSNKADFLATTYPDGFHYIGNSTQDFPVWSEAITGAAINPPASVSTVKVKGGDSVSILQNDHFTISTLLKCIRLHQWTKNGLIGLVPLLTFTSITVPLAIKVSLGFIAFSFLASATYIFNDLVDLPDDRMHASKSRRPLAAGKVSVPAGFIIMALLVLASILCLLFLPLEFSLVLLFYFMLTVSYTFFLKRIAIIDVIMLAGLFTIRVIGGAVLVGQSISPWLLNFIASFFFSLALVKRYTEMRKKEASTSLLGRGYEKDDEPLLLSLGIMGTGLALLSLLLYFVLAEDPVIQSQGARFALITVMTYWLMRIWMLAHRKTLNDDPVLFAVKDPISLVLGVLIAFVVLMEQLV
jgi:4-hydroxybenzoate polyprenyltransferase/phosphoserine phosphatase